MLMRLLSGAAALRALRGDGSSGLSGRDPWWPLDSADNLRQWLAHETTRWAEADQCWQAQRAIGLAELNAGRAYQELVRRHDKAAAAYERSLGRASVEAAEAALVGSEKAIAGLSEFVKDGDEGSSSPRRARAAAKLEQFRRTEADRQAAVLAATLSALPPRCD